MGKFKGILDDIQAVQSGVSQPEETPSAPSPAPLPPERKATRSLELEKRKPGRPKVGKSSDPAFVQVTAYVEEAVHLSVKKALLDAKGTDFSDLVNDLLKKWVKSRS